MTRTANRQKRSVTHVKLLFGIFVILLSSCFALGSYGQSISPASNPTETGLIAGLSDGTISGNMYHNRELGFRYEFPSGWSVSDKAMQARAVVAGHQIAWTDDTSARRGASADRQCSKSLLLATKYPEEMRLNNEVNSSALLIAADPKCIAGASFPSTIKDQAAIQQIASHLGIYFKTTTTTPQGPIQIHAFENGGRVMLEVSQRFSVYRHEPGTTTVQHIHSSVMVMKAERYWIMWMFASGDDVELERLRATKIFLDAGPG